MSVCALLAGAVELRIDELIRNVESLRFLHWVLLSVKHMMLQKWKRSKHGCLEVRFGN